LTGYSNAWPGAYATGRRSGADYAVLVNLTDVPEGCLRFLDLTNTVEWEKSRVSHHIARMAKRLLERL